ncbi:MAG: metal ABC transporter permease [Methanobacteriota archaeon]|nr:MAG: metal ABC transporter permease [Euryarchaeota archaeon]
MATLNDFFDVLQYGWMQRTVLAAILIGLICSLIGVFIILRGMVFIGEAIAHSAFAGAALALLLGFSDPLLVVLAFGIITALGIGKSNELEKTNDEIIVAIFFSSFMGLGIFFIGLLPSFSSNVQAILFGRILLITQRNVNLLILFSIITVAVIWLFKKEFYLLSFDKDLARISGIPITLLNYIFLVLIAMAIDVSIFAIGAILVFAMLVIPAATAYQLTYNFDKMILLSIGFGIFSSVGGLVLSFLYDLPSGATIVLLSTMVFVLVYSISPKRTGLIKLLSRKEPIGFDHEPLPHFHGQTEGISKFSEHLKSIYPGTEEK